MKVEEDVAADECPVGLAPERDVAGGVTPRVEHREPDHLVALLEAALDRVRAGQGHPVQQPGSSADSGRGAGALRDMRIPCAAPQGNSQRLADGVARPVVVGMRVGQRMRTDTAAAQLAQDPPVAELGAGVDQHIRDEVGVDRVARPAREPEYAGGELLDGEAYVPTRSRAPSTPSFSAQCAQQ
jgi:hypothetical protein